MTRTKRRVWQGGMVAGGIFLLLLPLLIQNSYVLCLIDQVLIFSVCVIGLNYITGLTGQNNLGMGAIFGLGAYTTALLSVDCGISPFLCLPFVILMGLLIGYALGRPSLRVKGIFLALTTLSFGEIIRILETNLQFTHASIGVRGIPSYRIFGFEFNTYGRFYYLALLALLLVGVLSTRIIHSRWGREFIAIRENEDSMASNGINVARVKITAFTLCAVIGCIAGAMYAHMINYIHPTDFKADLSIKFLMMLMLGGIGSIPGIIVGCSVVTLLPELLRVLDDYYMLIFSVILLLFAVLKPFGLVSIWRDIQGKIIRRGARFEATRKETENDP